MPSWVTICRCFAALLLNAGAVVPDEVLGQPESDLQRGTRRHRALVSGTWPVPSWVTICRCFAALLLIAGALVPDEVLGQPEGLIS